MIKLISYPPKKEWKIGDDVDYCGMKGKVVSLKGPNEQMPLQALFIKEGYMINFTSDGKTLLTHTEPSLSFVNRPGSFLDKLKNLFKRK